MERFIKCLIVAFVLTITIVNCCLITNCPRGGKRSNVERVNDQFIKQCISCGPQRSGRCFGPSICCGPFGCMIGTTETIRCDREGGFNELEPCIAGRSSCRGNMGRCATDGICCDQESCHTDVSCNMNDERREKSKEGRIYQLESLYNILSPYQSQQNYPLNNIINETI